MRRLDRFEGVTCGLDATIKEALSRIGRATPNLFQIVLTPEGNVAGTITDGDVRRAMLEGVTVADTVDKCMRHTPIVGRAGDDHANRTLLARVHFLPVVDAAERLDHVLVEDRRSPPIGRALLMAGGFGRRLGDLTRELPKPLLPVGGRPILDRMLEQMENCGIPKVTIAVHYKAGQIKDFVLQRSNLADVTFIEESAPLGTAGALARLHGQIDGPVLVVNGDVLTQVDLAAMHDFNLRHGNDGTIAVSRYEVQVPYGVIRQSGDGQFAGIDEKPRIDHFVAAGLYILSPEVVALTPRDRAVDMPELLTLAHRAGLRFGLFPVHEYWKDVGQPVDLALAQQDHEQNGS